jgi:hypothetical protein
MEIKKQVKKTQPLNLEDMVVSLNEEEMPVANSIYHPLIAL